MLYYMLDDGIIGGGNSAGVDITSDGKNYEVKAVRKTTNKVIEGKFVHNFKLGGTVNVSPVIKDLQELININKTEIPSSKINEYRNTHEFSKIENLYREAASYYFNNHEIIFLDNSTSKTRGNIIFIGRIKPESIYIERVTSGTVKPLIKIE